MLKKMKGYLFNEKYKRMITNFSYLSIINMVNKVLPLIVVPYIVRTIGVEKYGIIAFALALVSYFILITKYSFDLTAVKYISKHRENLLNISKHFWLVMGTRIFLALCSFIIYMFIIFSFERFSLEIEVFLFTFIMLFADILMPLWFFRGIEEMKYIAIFNIIAKILYTLCIFMMIHHETEYFWIPLINSLSLVLVSFSALYFAIKKFGILFIPPHMNDIKNALKEGKDIFWSNMSVSFYTTINTVLLGFLSTYTVVGIYSLALSIFSAYNSIIKTYTMVIYPHLARYIDDIQKLYTQARKFFKLYLLVLVAASAFLFIISDFVITLLFGEGHEESITILKILAIALLVEPLGGFFTAYLSLKSEYKTIRSITFKTMILNLILVVPMILLFNAKGVAYLLLILALVQVTLNLLHNREIIYMRTK